MKTTVSCLCLVLIALTYHYKKEKILPIAYTKPNAEILVVNVNKSNIADIYAKALWIKYKVKNKCLDRALKSDCLSDNIEVYY